MAAPVVDEVTEYKPNGLNQYSNAGGITLSYDDVGNLTSDGTWSYLYDAVHAADVRSGSDATSP